ncbi:Cysteine desulfurase [Paenibacillus plantiphilus]|uniref:Cysteine desulfurase n=1 Tax=Paenibacillus plantiphilus TaxID=2905650 RepID=A0ABM9C1R1_9BACL|nr:family 2A encapsulin nanocompartment cargo protein cysteine desulfurase [Paenibacillus plantiphilus]CAH1199180.1 Cysteine desulfurase [Paenibacillus plantiphilus]
MTINNFAGSGLPDPSVLAAIANQFFPEFSTPAVPVVPSASSVSSTASAGTGTAASYSPSLQSEIVPVHAALYEQDFLRAAAGLSEGYASSTETDSFGGYTSYTETDSFGGNTSYTETDSFRGYTPVIVTEPASSLPVPGRFDIHAIRRDFPILSEKINGKPLIWLDNAATTHKPRHVIDRISYYYEHENSNIHRAAHELAARSTDAYEGAREKVARFLNAPSPQQIVFVRGATEAINLVANSYARHNVKPGDEILITWLEHHANIVPWQMICNETGAKLRVAPVDEDGQIILSEFAKLLSKRTKLVSLTQVSNALGTITPVAEMVHLAHQYGAKVLVDGAQAVSHLKVDVQALDCDFYVFSGHKVFGPTGIGALYGKAEVLETMKPYQGGGNMIVDVTFEKTIIHPAPNRFEAGTGNIADAVGLGAAIDYVTTIGIEAIHQYEHYLLEYGTEALSKVPGLRFIGTAKNKASVMSFTLQGFTTEQVGQALSAEGIAVRSGHHCAQPILRRFGVEHTVRPSLAFYNTCEELDKLAEVILKLKS